jgi:hypothetical protein
MNAIKIVAVLHDTLEDTDLTTYELVRDYRPKAKVLDSLEAITKTEGQTYLDFILQIKKNKIATAVKIEDLNHNLSDLGRGNLREKYLMALYILHGNAPDSKQRKKEKGDTIDESGTDNIKSGLFIVLFFGAIQGSIIYSRPLIIVGAFLTMFLLTWKSIL